MLKSYLFNKTFADAFVQYIYIAPLYENSLQTCICMLVVFIGRCTNSASEATWEGGWDDVQLSLAPKTSTATVQLPRLNCFYKMPHKEVISEFNSKQHNFSRATETRHLHTISKSTGHVTSLKSPFGQMAIITKVVTMDYDC